MFFLRRRGLYEIYTNYDCRVFSVKLHPGRSIRADNPFSSPAYKCILVMHGFDDAADDGSYDPDMDVFKSEIRDPIIALWRAVIVQQMIDIAPRKNKTRAGAHIGEASANRVLAESWFNTRNRDFCMVCDFAGLLPEYVVRRITELLEAPSGEVRVKTPKPDRGKYRPRKTSNRQRVKMGDSASRLR